MIERANTFFDKHKDYAEVFIRMIIGFHLIYGTQDNVFSWERMLEFSEFLANFGFPIPLVSAVVSVYAQFICGILFIIGYQVRIAAIIMIGNFIIALLMVHTGDTYPGAFPAIMMLAGSLYLLFNGSKVLNVNTLFSKTEL
ncbi:MAG: DoxX family protein [Balneola sp.]|jgi:putative oxidoreductase